MNVDVQIAVKSPCSQYFGDVYPAAGWLAHTVFLFVELPVFRDTCLWNHRSVCCCRQMVQLGGNSVVVLVAQSCPTLRPHRLWPARLLCPWDYPVRILEWIAIPFSRVSSQPRDWTWVPCTAGRFSIVWAAGKVRFLNFQSSFAPCERSLQSPRSFSRKWAWNHAGLPPRCLITKPFQKPGTLAPLHLLLMTLSPCFHMKLLGKHPREEEEAVKNGLASDRCFIWAVGPWLSAPEHGGGLYQVLLHLGAEQRRGPEPVWKRFCHFQTGQKTRDLRHSSMRSFWKSFYFFGYTGS